jgi:hypothetical protein
MRHEPDSLDETRLLHAAQRYIVRHLKQVSKQANEPIFVAIDDTICQKTNPSLRARQAIQGCEYHYSHADHECVWEHQSVWMMMHARLRHFHMRSGGTRNRPASVKLRWPSRWYSSFASPRIVCMS